jgi:hypothetical protein
MHPFGRFGRFSSAARAEIALRHVPAVKDRHFAHRLKEFITKEAHCLFRAIVQMAFKM